MWFIGVEVEQEKSAPPPKKSWIRPCIQRCGKWYIHMTVLKASHRVMPGGLGGWVVDRPLRSIIVN